MKNHPAARKSCRFGGAWSCLSPPRLSLISLWLAVILPTVLLSQAEAGVLPSPTAALTSRPSPSPSQSPATTAAARHGKIPISGGRVAALTEVMQIRKLSPEAAAGLIPVRIKGVVTDLSGWQNSFFVQDSTGGISVNRTDRAEVRLGDEVLLTGTSDPGLFAPVIMASEVRVTGHGSAPLARRVTLGDMVDGAQDSQWIEVRGVIHSAKVSKLFTHDVVNLSLEIGGGSVDLILQDFAGLDYKLLVDATVVVRGVCSTTFNEKRQFVGLGMYVPDRKDIEILRPASVDPFAAPVLPIRTVLQFGESLHRVKVEGIATYQVPGHSLYLQDGADGIRLQSSSTELVQLGQRVEAVGFPVKGEYSPILQDGFFRVVGTGLPVKPLRIAAKDVITQGVEFAQVHYDQQLVQVQGTVEEIHTQGDHNVWLLRQDGLVFTMRLPISGANGAQNIGFGNVVLVTGICSIRTDSDHIPASFSILLRSRDDILVVKRASWWTLSHTLSVLAALFGAMILVILWVVILRGQVEEQTRVIRTSEGRFRDLAQQDTLTGLPNRLLLEERIAECLVRCKNDRTRAALFTIDIDRFKQINDTYGHLVGDECLKAVAARIGSTVRQGDTIARTGGEEFMLIVGGFTELESAKRISSEILNLFTSAIVLPGLEVRLTLSIGGAVYPEDGADSEELRRRSDQALYEAKRTGRNRVVFATEKLWASIELETAIETALRDSLREDKFRLHYQPIYDPAGAICRFEALLRTTDEVLNKLGPARFIPVAEASGLIVFVGRWVMTEACRQVAEWQSAGDFHFPVGVNISGQQLTHQGFADEVRTVLERFHIQPEMMELELTETTAMAELASVVETMTDLAQSGLSFAVDDFGTGYSSLSRLCELPIKALKIDRSFVTELGKSSSSHTIIQAIIQMAKSLDLKVVAEGVETEAQCTMLRELGCDYFQGFLFSRPLPASAVIEAMVKNRSRLLAEAS